MTPLNRSVPINGRALLDGPYRYSLSRSWGDDHAAVLFVMLNPSTADATEDDPTIRRCIGFARAWDFSGIEVANLFAWRATDPKALRAAADPIGPRNDDEIRAACERSSLIVAAWGQHRFARDRALAVTGLLLKHGPVHCIAVTKDGSPRHPLYAPYQGPRVWRSA